MAVHVKDLSDEDKMRLRRAEVKRAVADGGHPGYGADEAVQIVEDYMALLEELHEAYDLEPDELYEFDAARGAVFKE